jgi:Zn-dependent protease with chaperone function
MVEDFFFKLGREARSQLRKGRWIWSSLTGGEHERLEAEYVAGRDLARQFDRQAVFDRDARVDELLSEITVRLTARLKNKQRRWRVLATSVDEPGAFALPGGFLYVTRPLLDLCRFNPDEIACIVGHEIGHVVRGHAMERMTNQLLTSAASRMARIPGSPLAQWGLAAGINLIQSAYSRDQELDADVFGARLAGAAGYDSRGAIRAFERLGPLVGGSKLPLAEYFASHPPIPERIRHLERSIRD